MIDRLKKIINVLECLSFNEIIDFILQVKVLF